MTDLLAGIKIRAERTYLSAVSCAVAQSLEAHPTLGQLGGDERLMSCPGAAGAELDVAEEGTFRIVDGTGLSSLFRSTPVVGPCVASLDAGAVRRRVVALASSTSEDEGIAIRSMAHFALTYDSGAVDDVEAARFLGTLKGGLERGSLE